MHGTPQDRELLLSNVHVIDGGLGSELEYLGARIDGPLWSAHVIDDAPEKLIAVHRAYIEAGAECIFTGSYQISRMGYWEVGLKAEQADAALLRSIELARKACAEFPNRRVLVAASLGPYGAALHNGSEYHGNYDLSFTRLVEFHRERIEVIAEQATDNQVPDLLAFETLPSLEEAHAIAEALAPWPHLAAWFSFTCRDDQYAAHGEPMDLCAASVAQFPHTVAIGVNCVPPARIASLIRAMRSATSKPIAVYPNSGEEWNAHRRCWTGAGDPASYGTLAREWFAAGAQMVGGCCRTRPGHIRMVAEAALRQHTV